MAHVPTINDYNEDINWSSVNRPLAPSIALARVVNVIATWTGIIGIAIVLIAFSPIIAIVLFALVKAFSRMRKDSEKLRLQVKETYLTMSFEELEREEAELNKVLSHLKQARDEMGDSKLFPSVPRNLSAVIQNFESIENMLVSRRTIAKDEMFDSEEEFQEYQEAMKSLGDVWNYESTSEEKEYVFNRNKK